MNEMHMKKNQNKRDTVYDLRLVRVILLKLDAIVKFPTKVLLFCLNYVQCI